MNTTWLVVDKEQTESVERKVALIRGNTDSNDKISFLPRSLPSLSLFPRDSRVPSRRPRYIVIKWSPFGCARTLVYYVAGLLRCLHTRTDNRQPARSA